MSPSAEVYSRFREPSNFDSDFASERTVPVLKNSQFSHFPSKGNGSGDEGYDDDDDDERYTSSGGGRSRSRPHSQHYTDFTDGAPRSRLTSLSRTRTSSSAKRSRKTSASTARDLVRALLHEKLETDTSTEVQLARAYDIIKEESRRAAEAERAAIEASQRLKALALSRANATKEASRAQSELRAYKLQLENAQRQLQEANVIAAASEAERVRAEQATRKMKHTVERLRLSEYMRRAREEGRREGLLESRGVTPAARSTPFASVPITEDNDDDDVLPRTPVSNVPLPVPPPDYPPIVSRRAPTPTFRRAQTPMSAVRGSQGTRTPVPDVIRRNTTPPSRRSQTPSHPVPPPASIPVLSRRAETPGPSRRPPVYDEFDPVPEARDLHINPVPDHIIIRSPVPMRPSPQSPPAQPHPRPPSSQASHRRSTLPSQDHHQPRPQPPRHARHYSIDDPAARASASASRIYSHYSTSTDSSASEPPAQRPSSRALRHRETLPQQETIIPRPPTADSAHRFAPPVPNDAVPDSAAAFARARAGRRPRPPSNSSSTPSPRAFPTPSSVARLQRLPLGDRKWSVESSSSIPGITIEPPSRPESVDSIATGVTLPSHMSPFIDSDTPLPNQGPQRVQTPGRGGVPMQGLPRQHSHPHGPAHPPRPSSRTGFAYGPMGPAIGDPGTIRGPSSPGPGMGPFGGPQSPQMTPTMNNFGVPGPSNQPGLPHPGPDYFTDHHHRNRNMNGHGHGPGHGHRREPAGISVDNLGTIPAQQNTFGDTDSDDEAEFRAPTPRAGAGPPGMTPFAFGEPRGHAPGTPGAGSLHNRNGTPASMAGSSAGGFIPPRPPSSSAAATEDFAGPGPFSPRQVPLPASSGSASVYTSHSASVDPGASNRRGAARNRRTTIGPNGRPASRTAFGNTPFVRSSGLYDD